MVRLRTMEENKTFSHLIIILNELFNFEREGDNIIIKSSSFRLLVIKESIYKLYFGIK